jgi:hypothetical protein
MIARNRLSDKQTTKQTKEEEERGGGGGKQQICTITKFYTNTIGVGDMIMNNKFQLSICCRSTF